MKLWIRQKWMMLLLFLTPFFLIIVFAVGMTGFIGTLTLPEYGTVRYIDFMIPGVTVSTIFTGAILGSISVFLDRELRVLQELFVTPLKRRNFVIGKIFASTTKASLAGYFTIALAGIVGAKFYGVSSITMMILLVPLISLGCSGFAIALTSVIKTQSTYNAMVNTITVPLFFLSNLYYPIELLPPLLKILVFVNPLSHMINPLRAVMLIGFFPEPILFDVLFLFIFTIATTVIGFTIYEKTLAVV